MSYSRNARPAPGNPFKIGDIVKLDYDLKDSYQETRVSAGELQEIMYFSDDGRGCMFACQLGAHYKNCIPVGAAKTRIDKEKLIAASKKAAANFSTGHGA